MRKRRFDFMCPWCGNSFSCVRDTYLLAGNEKDPDEKRLLDGTYFLHQCQRCKKTFTLSHPLLYRDPTHHFAICLSEQKQIDSDGERTIVARNTTDFLFALQVLHDGLDLKEMIQIRSVVSQKSGQVRYVDFDQSRSIVWFLRDHDLIGFMYHHKRSSN